MGLPKATIRTHVRRWLPENKDGPIDLIAYAAWLNRRLAEAQADGD